MKYLNKIKRISFISFIFLLMLGFSFIFSSCEDIKEVIKIDVEQISGTGEYKIGEFNYSDYELVVYYDKGNPSRYTLSDKTIPASEQMKLFQEGEQTITVEYSNLTCDFVVTFKRNAFTGITLENKTFTYDGNPKYLEITGELPSGTEVIYVGNGNTSVGTYDVKCCLTNPTYATVWLESAVMTITKGDYYIDDEKISEANILKDLTVTYDGKTHEIVVDKELPKDVSVIYSVSKNNGAKENGNSGTNVGEYLITASFKIADELNYNPIPDKTAYLTITKADYEIVYSEMMTNLKNKFNDLTVVYDGKNHVIELDNDYKLPNGVTISYSIEALNTVKKFDGKNASNVGTYEFSCNFTGDEENFLPINPLKAKLTIVKKTITNDTLVYDDQEYVYTGSPLLTEIFEENYDVNYSVEYIITDNKKIVVDNAIDVGEYQVEAKFTYLKSEEYPDGDPNYDANFSLYSNLTITKATVSKLFAFESKYFEYTGLSQSLVVSDSDLSYIPNIAPIKDENGEYIPFIKSVIYQNNTQTDVGTYSVSATFILNEVYENNFNAPNQINSTFTINKHELLDTEIENIFKTAYAENCYTGENVKCIIENIPSYLSFKCYVNDILVSSEIENDDLSFILGINAKDYRIEFKDIEIDLTGNDNILNMVGLTEFSETVTIDKAIMSDELIGSITYSELSLPYVYNEIKELTISNLPFGMTFTATVNGEIKEVIGSKFIIGETPEEYSIALTYSLENYYDKVVNKTFTITKAILTEAEFTKRLIFSTDIENGNKAYVSLNDESRDLFNLTLKVNSQAVDSINDKYLIGITATTYSIDYLITLTDEGNDLYTLTGDSLSFTNDYTKEKTMLTITSETIYAKYKSNSSCSASATDGTVKLSNIPSSIKVEYKYTEIYSFFSEYNDVINIPNSSNNNIASNLTVNFKFTFIGDAEDSIDNYDIKFVNIIEGTTVSIESVNDAINNDSTISVLCKVIDLYNEIKEFNPETFVVKVNYNDSNNTPYLYVYMNDSDDYNATVGLKNEGTKGAYLNNTSYKLNMDSLSGYYYFRYKLSTKLVNKIESLTLTFGYDLLDENNTTVALDPSEYYVNTGKIVVEFDDDGKVTSASFVRASDNAQIALTVLDITTY